MAARAHTQEQKTETLVLRIEPSLMRALERCRKMESGEVLPIATVVREAIRLYVQQKERSK